MGSFGNFYFFPFRFVLHLFLTIFLALQKEVERALIGVFDGSFVAIQHVEFACAGEGGKGLSDARKGVGRRMGGDFTIHERGFEGPQAAGAAPGDGHSDD